MKLLRLVRVATATSLVALAFGLLFTSLRNSTELQPYFYTDAIFQLVETNTFWALAASLLGLGITVGVGIVVALGWIPRSAVQPSSRAAICAALITLAIPAAVLVFKIPVIGHTFGPFESYLLWGPAMVGLTVAGGLAVLTKRWLWAEATLMIASTPIASVWGWNRYAVAYAFLGACAGSWLFRANPADDATELADAPEPAHLA